MRVTEVMLLPRIKNRQTQNFAFNVLSKIIYFTETIIFYAWRNI